MEHSITEIKCRRCPGGAEWWLALYPALKDGAKLCHPCRGAVILWAAFVFLGRPSSCEAIPLDAALLINIGTLRVPGSIAERLMLWGFCARCAGRVITRK